jgi:predicted nucleic acid-binding protein
MRLYLDANIIIYLIEAVEPFQSRIRNHIFSIESQSASELITSRLSCLECRSKPLAEKNLELLGRYDQFFSRSLLQLVEITPDVIDRATTIRAQYGFKSADAIHLASGILRGADLFLTGDTRLYRCSELRTEIV